MVMDDEDIVRNIAENMLDYLGCDVVLVKDGAEAIEVYKASHATEEPIDMIIMDLTVPSGLGGSDAVKEILAINPEAKVVVSSGYAGDPIISDYMKFGFMAALVKPYKLRDLSTIIETLLGT